MNQRIRELVNKAIGDVDYIRDNDDLNQELANMYIPDCFAEKFAELIVEECMWKIMQRKEEAIDNDWRVDKAMSAALSDISEHFGVEE